MRLAIAAIAVAGAASLGTAAGASVIQWTLNGPIIQSADPIAGSFLFDTSTSTFSDINLVSPATSPSDGLTFDTFFGQAGDALIFGQGSADPDGSQTALSLTSFLLDDLDTPAVLYVNAEGSARFAEFRCASRSACAGRTGSNVSNWERDGAGTLTGQFVTTPIPVPAALPLAATGFALLGLLGLRRRACGCDAGS